MGSSKVAPLAVAIVVAVFVCSTVIHAEMTKDDRPAATFVRSDTTADKNQNNEERGVNVDAIPGVTKLTATVNSIAVKT
ncbi:hypothetical protein PC128_g27838, partial [Phytophthora cactorum]